MPPSPGPRRLYVLRHAKSSWNNAYMADFDRPLAPRGQRAAALLAEHFATVEPPPALVLCSSARRTVDTLEPIRARLPEPIEVLVEDGLYGASAPELVARLRLVPDGTGSVLLVGHNPGVEDLVRGLGRQGDAEAIARVHAKYPTGALATLTLPGSWASFGAEPAVLEHFVVPAELE